MAKEAEVKPSPLMLVTKFVQKKGPWNKKDLQFAIYWVKMILAVATGLFVGLMGLTGAIGNLIHIAVCHLAVQLFVSSMSDVDVEAMFGTSGTIVFEGLMPCYAMFLLIWTALHTMTYKTP